MVATWVTKLLSETNKGLGMHYLQRQYSFACALLAPAAVVTPMWRSQWFLRPLQYGLPMSI